MKYRLQYAKRGLNLAPHTANPVALGLRPRLTLTTIIARWCDDLDPMPLQQYWCKGWTVKRSITQDQQIVGVLEECTHRRGVVVRGWCQQPIVHDLAHRRGDVQA